MNMIEHLAASLEDNLSFLPMILADFSDSDMLVRPCPPANHAAWQVGHLICSENGLVNDVSGGVMPSLPEGFRERFTRETSKSDDPARFPTKAVLLDEFVRQRRATVAWVRGLTEADLDRPSPERFRAFIPTVAALVILLPSHVAMHAGQIQVIRRKLGKPVLM